jgi:hypothetical protein
VPAPFDAVLPDDDFPEVRLAVFFAAVELFAVDFGAAAARLVVPLLFAADLELLFTALVALPTADLDDVRPLVVLELLPDLAFPPFVLDAGARDADLADFDALDEVDPERVDFEAEDFFAGEADEDFARELAEPVLFLVDEVPFVAPPTVLTTAFAVPTAAPAAAPCRISPTTSFALSYIVSRVPLEVRLLRPRLDVVFLPADDLDVVVLLERLFGIARLLYLFFEKNLRHTTNSS